jgi:hypothetical protein
MIVWAMGLVTLVTMSALSQSYLVRMIFLLLPPMTVSTFILIGTTVFITTNEGSRTPVGTLLLSILVNLRFSPEILPIMGKHTNIPLMLSLVIGAPHSFKMEHIEVDIILQLINQLYRYFSFRMSE